VARLVHDQHRHGRGDGVEFFTGGVALLLELRVVVTEPDDPAHLRDDGFVLPDPGLGQALDRRDIGASGGGSRFADKAWKPVLKTWP